MDDDDDDDDENNYNENNYKDNSDKSNVTDQYLNFKKERESKKEKINGLQNDYKIINECT